MNKVRSIAAAMLLCSVAASAAGTASGTDITNTATLSFSVGGVSQTDVVSNTDTFKVDKKIDFILTHEDSPKHLVVVAGKQDNERSFKLVNESNEIQDFTVAVSNLAGDTYDGKTDSAEMQNLEISIDNGSTWATGPVTVNDLAVDGELTIQVRGDVLISATDGEVMNVQLEATAVKNDTTTPEESTSGADNKTAIDTVLAEGAGASDFANTQFDGKYSAWAGYLVNTPNLTLTKNSCVLKDSVNGVSTEAKRIPGATVLYMLDIENKGTSTDATDVSISDTLDATLDSGSIANLKEDDGKTSCSCTNGEAYAGGNAATNSGSGSALKVEGLTITKEKHNCVSFEVNII